MINSINNQIHTLGTQAHSIEPELKLPKELEDALKNIPHILMAGLKAMRSSADQIIQHYEQTGQKGYVDAVLEKMKVLQDKYDSKLVHSSLVNLTTVIPGGYADGKMLYPKENPTYEIAFLPPVEHGHINKTRVAGFAAQPNLTVRDDNNTDNYFYDQVYYMSNLIDDAGGEDISLEQLKSIIDSLITSSQVDANFQGFANDPQKALLITKYN